MPIRMTGLTSGLDTDSIVQALMSAKSAKKTKVESKRQKLEWKQEIWSDMNKKIYSFYNTSLSKVKMQSSFKTKSAVSSNASKITATASSTAAEGTYRVKVNSVASAQYVTSGKLKGVKAADGSVKAATTSSKLVDLVDADGNQSFTSGTQITINARDGKKVNTLTVDENTSISDFMNSCKEAGLNVVFDNAQQRFFINSPASGEAQKFTISASKLDSTQMDTMQAWKDAIGYDYLSYADQTAVTKIFNNLQNGVTTYSDTVGEKLQSYLSKAQNTAVKRYYSNELTEQYRAQFFEEVPSLDEEGNPILDDEGNAVMKKVATQAGLDALYTVETVLDEEGNPKLDEEGNTITKKVLTEDGKKVISAKKDLDKLTEAEINTALNKLVSNKVTEDLKTEEYQEKITNGVTAGIPDSSDSFLNTSASGRSAALLSAAEGYHATMSSAASADSALAAIGLGKVSGANVKEGDDASGMVVVQASDASVTFNGATLTSSTSTLNVSGLTLNIMDVTPNEELTITVAKDTSEVYDFVKSFISEYNSILSSMNEAYNASSAKGYDVLTDEQKEAMTDDEIDKWETKIKSSLLRRDETLNGIITSFRDNMTGSVKLSDGKRYSLASIGICTSTDYKEGGLLHIKGDEDDEEYSDEKNTLQKMLEDDPDKVMDIINGLAKKLYDDLGKKMQTSTLSSALTFYNDKEMTKQLKDYKSEISDWETKLNELEDRYYKQFSVMEKTLANLNSQQSSLSGFFG